MLGAGLTARLQGCMRAEALGIFMSLPQAELLYHHGNDESQVENCFQLSIHTCLFLNVVRISQTSSSVNLPRSPNRIRPGEATAQNIKKLTRRKPLFLIGSICTFESSNGQRRGNSNLCEHLPELFGVIATLLLHACFRWLQSQFTRCFLRLSCIHRSIYRCIELALRRLTS